MSDDTSDTRKSQSEPGIGWQPPEHWNPSTDDQALEAMQRFMGMPYEPSIRDELLRLTDRPVYGPHDAKSRDLNPFRITIQTDDQDLITGIQFG
ncbi:hypothetical protein IAE35_08415 [Pseudomonas sp. S75]|uniref:hypothetical protein n=1 Tax=unclassified Pseudomonas TaxID=196821 RepID=UPI001903CC33|nr:MULTISPECIES: hypothetical protein [unclassified Pseudomonas]MBJ9974585.1 hypothetical protein [Pseudomonas sp. S30]MBK0153364.1 hypothetical protein [Pseudomonas sp. S75]